MDPFLENQSSDVVQHHCESYRDGDWIVFTCSKCLSYERRLNWRTGEMKIKEGEDPGILHAGEYFPIEYEYAMTSVN